MEIELETNRQQADELMRRLQANDNDDESIRVDTATIMRHKRRGRRRRCDDGDDMISLSSSNSSLITPGQRCLMKRRKSSLPSKTTSTAITRIIKSSFTNVATATATTKTTTTRRRRGKITTSIISSILLIILALFSSDSSRFNNVNLFQLQPSEAFNIDTQSAIVHSGPSKSRFGFSVAQHKDRNVNWLLVGAPNAQTDQPGTREAGAVFRCDPKSTQVCQPINFDHNGPSMITLRGEKFQISDKSHQGFGFSLQSATENGSIVSCAPRYVYFSTNLKRRDPVGTCWLSRGSFTGFLEFSPCQLDDQWGHHHLGSCQAGFSTAISKDGSRMFMGAPGSHVWQGQVFAHNLRNNLTNSTSWVNPHSEDDSYLGYSLALGRFSSSPATEVDVAIGMPRGHNLAGKVMIVDREMRTMRNLTGEQMGSYFGYSIISVDVNGDSLDDLIIGAPMYYNQTISHKEPHFDRGRIYVALQNMRHEFNLIQHIDGQKNRARFGTSLANCGDLNRDGSQDVAVGAPYDGPDERGAVYIYLGRRTSGGGGGLSADYDQVIYAESIRSSGVDLNNNQALRTFGFSLSAGLDMDGNMYPDLLVGAYDSDKVVLLKTRPVVNVTTSLTFHPENFNLDDKTCLLPNSSTSVSCITVQYCTKYTGLNVDNRLGFVYDIKLDTENKGAPRLFFLNNEGKNEDRNTSMLTKDTNQCKSFKAYIMRQIRDKLTPLKIDIDYNLADYAGETYDYNLNQPKLRPVLNKLTSNKLSKVATIQKNCGPDNVCIPDLKLTVKPNLDQYTIGSNEKLVLNVTVKNWAEDAFESMFYLTMPMTIDYITINKTRGDPVCYGAKPDQTGVNILTCDLGNPQVKGEVVEFSVITEPARVGAFTSPDFTFVAQVNSTNPELDDRAREDNQVAIGIPIKVDVKLVLSGNSQPTMVIHNSTHHQARRDLLNRQPSSISTSSVDKLTEADIGPEVYHTYQLQNRGPSTINDIALTILWPTKTSDGKYLLYLVDEPFTSDKIVCKPSANDTINPLNLRYLRGNSINSPQHQKQIATTTPATTTLSRQKRQNNDQQQPIAMAQQNQPATKVDNSVLQQLNLLTCDPKRCTHFECNVYQLGHNEIATIKIRSRLYEDTINELSYQEFDVSSKLVAQVKSLPYNVSSQSIPPDVYKVETQVHTTGIAVSDLLPWWIIVLAILLGVLLFVLLAYFLRYLGFFARKRPPKGAEREPLTPMWQDYHYTPGDTAL